MTAAPACHSQVLLAVWRQRDLASPWVRRVLAALFAAGAAAALIWLPLEIGWRLVAGLLTLVVLGGWLAVSANLQEQNHPHAARCVPGHLRTLRGAALLGWALCTALTTLLLWAVMPPSDTWRMLLLSSGAIATFLMWTSRMVWLWLLLMMLSPLLGSLAGQLAPVIRAVAAVWAAHADVVLLLSLLVQAGLVVLAFGAGDARHRARYARQAVMRNAMRMQFEGRALSAAAWGRPIEWLLQPFSRTFDAWQRRLLARADNRSPRNVMARAAIVLHGTQHWLYQLMSITAVLGVVLLAFVVVSRFTPVTWSNFLPGALGMGIGIASMGLNPAFALPTTLWQSRREQALLCLLPAMPRGAALSRAVAAHQLRDGLVAWGATSAALLALGLAADSPWLLCLPLAALPVLAVNLTRRVAAMRAPNTMATVWPVLAFFTVGGLLYALVFGTGLSMGLLAALVVPSSALLLAWRWRALGAAPAALPAGRLS